MPEAMALPCSRCGAKVGEWCAPGNSICHDRNNDWIAAGRPPMPKRRPVRDALSATVDNLTGHLRNWMMEKDNSEGGRTRIAWVEDDGPRREVDMPTWLVTAIIERYKS